MVSVVLLLGSVLAVGGCSSTPQYTPSASSTELAAYAAHAVYPTGMTPRQDLAVTCTINRLTGDITIRNFTEGRLENPRLWINHSYVLQLNNIGPNGSVTVRRNDIYNNSGLNLSQQSGTGIGSIQIQTNNNLIDVKGPQFN